MVTLAALDLIELFDFALVLSLAAFLFAAGCWYRLREFSLWCYLMMAANVALAATCFMWYRINQTRFAGLSTSEMDWAVQKLVGMACLGIVSTAVGNTQISRRLRQQQRFWHEFSVAVSVEEDTPERSR